MTTEDIDMKAFVDEFRTDIRRYWKQNVKRYFSKREIEYGLQPKLNHRFMFAQTVESGQPRLKNALVVNWTPASNHVTVYVAPIMVRSVTIGKRVPRGTETMTGDVVRGRHTPRAFDVITLLGTRHRPSPGTWIATIDRRVKRGERQSSDPRIWQNWFNRFIGQVDRKLEKFADKVADETADKILPVEEF